MAGRHELLRKDVRSESFGTTKLMYLLSKLTYVGFHPKEGADVNGSGWVFKKLIWSGSNLVDVRKISNSGCSWTGVTNAGWT